MKHSVLILVACSALGGALCAQAKVQLKFGVYTSDKPTTMYRQFLPAVEAVEEFMEAKLKNGDRPGESVDVEIDFMIFKTYEEGIDGLVNGTVDFVRFGPASYILAKDRNPEISLLAMESIKGKKRFQGMIVVRKDSKIETIKDLQGKKFAFGDPNSTIGRYLVQEILATNGVFAGSLASFDYLSRHDKVFSSVELGDFDAGSLKSETFNKMNKSGALRVLVTFPNVTKPWVARAGLDPKVRDALSDGLVNLAHPEALKNLQCDGFFPTSDDEFAFVRQGMKRAERFNDSGVAKAADDSGKTGSVTQPGGN